jgi:hypothetical protein
MAHAVAGCILTRNKAFLGVATGFLTAVVLAVLAWFGAATLLLALLATIICLGHSLAVPGTFWRGIKHEPRRGARCEI